MDLSKLSALPHFMERFQASVARCPRLPKLADARHPEGLTRRDVDELSPAGLPGHEPLPFQS